MAIIARNHKGQLDAAEAAAVRKFFENPALDSRYQEHNANQLEDYMYRWGVVIDAESLAVAFQKLSEAGVLKLRSEAQQKYDAATQGYTQAHQDVLDAWLKRNHLVHDPTDDKTFANCAEMFQAMKGREFNDSNLNWCRDYLLGKGVKLYCEDRPSQRTTRGHIATSPADYRFAPKEMTNTPGPGLVSHSSNPKFNGTEERLKREASRPADPQNEIMKVFWNDKIALAVSEGRTHSERNRIAQVARQTPGGLREQAKAAEQEVARIRRDRERGR